MYYRKQMYFVRSFPRHRFFFRTPDYKVFVARPGTTSDIPDGDYDAPRPGIPSELLVSGSGGGARSSPVVPDGLGGYKFTQLYIIATGRCNFSCLYCAQSKGGGGNMPAALMLQNIRSFLDRSRDPQGIVFYGGEPLLNWEAVRESIQLVRGQRSGTEITIFTNGSLVSQGIASFIAQHGVGVIVSLDGPAHIHNSARPARGQADSFQMAATGFQHLKDAGCRVGISCVLGGHNCEKVEEVTHFLCSLGPTNIGMNILHAERRSGYAFSPALGAEAVVRASRIASAYRIEIEQFARRLRSFVFETPRRGDCPACGSRLVVTPDGWVGPCEGAFPFVKEWFFQDGDGLENLSKALARWPCSHRDCQRCEASGMCGGGCVLDAYLDDPCLHGLDNRTCHLSKAVVDFALRTLAEESSGLEDGMMTVDYKRSTFSAYLRSDNSRPLQTSSKFGEGNNRVEPPLG